MRVMNRQTRVFWRIAAVIIVAGGGFVLLQRPARHAEAVASAGVLRIAGTERVQVAGASAVEVVPERGSPFRAIVTPSCSSISSLLALGCLGALVKGRRGRNKALIAAIVTVAVGNIVRIAASLAVGIVAGRASLVLFHDWVGSMFGFAYTLGGYLLLLYLLLPRSPKEPKQESASVVFA